LIQAVAECRTNSNDQYSLSNTNKCCNDDNHNNNNHHHHHRHHAFHNFPCCDDDDNDNCSFGHESDSSYWSYSFHIDADAIANAQTYAFANAFSNADAFSDACTIHCTYANAQTVAYATADACAAHSSADSTARSARGRRLVSSANQSEQLRTSGVPHTRARLRLVCWHVQVHHVPEQRRIVFIDRRHWMWIFGALQRLWWLLWLLWSHFHSRSQFQPHSVSHSRWP
jgi:hypothetical protein